MVISYVMTAQLDFTLMKDLY